VKLYEFESKEIAARYGIPTPRARIATNPQEASRVARDIEGASTRWPVYLVSEIGGIEIEELAKKHPEKIHKIYVDPGVGYTDYMAREVLQTLKLAWTFLQDIVNITRAMYRTMTDYDAELVEFNPPSAYKRQQARSARRQDNHRRQ